MYKLLAGVLSIIIFAPVALFASNVAAADTTAVASVVEMIESPSEIIPDQQLESQIESALESQAEQLPADQSQVIQEPAVPQARPPEVKKDSPEQVDIAYAALQTFVQQVSTGQTDVITGVFVAEDFTLEVVQQPQNNPGFISEEDGVVTDFALSRDYGTIGLLAHNYLAGDRFDELLVGQEIHLVYGDNQFVTYSIINVESYRALSPHSPYSDFVRLDGTETQVSATDLFYQVYGQEDALVLQTCIENEGNQSWGRLFITAVPTDSPADLAMAVGQP
ncbi:MAG: hypothetical protein JW757_13125 [Anaerolineales bacterium]|nr:hypothetical protein [Anaerolineales bacterium]